MIWFLIFLVAIMLATLAVIAGDVFGMRRAGRSGALLGLLTVLLMAALAVLSFTSWNPPNWSRILISVSPALLWPVALALSIVGLRRRERVAVIGLVSCALVAAAFAVMLNVAY